MLERVVAEMDRRHPAHPDQQRHGADRPGLPAAGGRARGIPGLLRLLDTVDAKGYGKTARACVARLLSEGRKAGVRVVILMQRADANIIGGYERGQASHRISFRVDTAGRRSDAAPASRRGCDRRTLATAAPGIGLLSAPGRPLTRFRAPMLPYGDYVQLVIRTGRGMTNGRHADAAPGPAAPQAGGRAARAQRAPLVIRADNSSPAARIGRKHGATDEPRHTGGAPGCGNGRAFRGCGTADGSRTP